jgi:hypothetical protein
MARVTVDIYRKAILDTGIAGKDWRKNEAFDDFTRYFNEQYTDEQRQLMKYDAILKITRAWWDEHRSKYS